VIPDVYNGILTDMEIVEVKKRILSTSDSAVLSMTSQQMRAKALEGFFVRDTECNLVYCPQGEILRQKSIKRNGNIRYCNKLACKKCKCKCTISKFKEADFSKDELIKATDARRKQKAANDSNENPKPQRTTVVKKVVRYVLHLDQKKMNNRKCLSEHPFGTIKRTLGHYYFLLRGFAKVSAEMSLFCLSYNLRRAINLKGVPALLAAFR
jgi:transposase